MTAFFRVHVFTMPEHGGARGYRRGVCSHVSMTQWSPGEEPSHQVRVPDDALLTCPRVQVTGERMRDGIGMGSYKICLYLLGRNGGVVPLSSNLLG